MWEHLAARYVLHHHIQVGIILRTWKKERSISHTVNQLCRKQDEIETTPWRRIPVWRGRGTIPPVISSSRLACVLFVSISPPANTQYNASYIRNTLAMYSRFLQINTTGEWYDENHNIQRHLYKIQSVTQCTVLLRNYSNILFNVYKNFKHQVTK